MNQRDQGAYKLAFLVVDDNPANLQLAAYLIRATGYEVRVAHSAAEGLAAARHGPCDYALIDVHMPDVGGTALADALRADPATSHIRLVMFTATATPAEREQGQASGFTASIDKPYEPEAFMASVRRLAGEAS
jgi:two-component system cell cycle response regulator